MTCPIGLCLAVILSMPQRLLFLPPETSSSTVVMSPSPVPMAALATMHAGLNARVQRCSPPLVGRFGEATSLSSSSTVVPLDSVLFFPGILVGYSLTMSTET